MIHLPYLSVARFTGPDAGPFLHAQLSADVTALGVGASTFATYCSSAGKVLALLLIGRLDQGYVVIGSSELLAGIIDRMKIFVLRAKVEIEPAPQTQVSAVLSSEAPTPVLSPGVGALRYTWGVANSPSSEDADKWKYQELLHGVSWLDSETSEKFIPQMLGFEKIGAVSFSKGCYPGQEIVARTRYLGKVKRTPLTTVIEGKAGIENGARVQVNYATETIEGKVVDSAPAEDQNTLLFIVTRTRVGEQPDSIGFNNTSFLVMP